MKKLSIRSRLALAYTLGVGILLVFSGAALYRTVSLGQQEQVDSQIEERAAVIRPLFSVSREGVSWLFDRQLVDRSTVRVAYAIYDPEGRYLDGSPLASLYSLSPDSSSTRALQTREPEWSTIQTMEGHPVRVMSTPISGSDGRVYLLLVGMLMDQVQTDLGRLATALWTLGPLVLVIGGVTGWWLAQGALRPVAEITEAAQRISATHLNDRLPLHGTNDELDRLSAQLNQMMGRLQRSFDQMSEFISNVSHELRTPLAAIRGSCEIALRTAQSEEECRKVLAGNIDELDRMTRTVSDLLAFARAEAGQVKLNTRPERLDELARDAVESLRVLAQERGVTLRLADSTAMTAEVDPQHVLRVLINLLDNAIKYNRPSGEVIVGLRRDGPFAVISVADTGHGITTEDLPHLFDRFYRSAVGEAGSVGGTGLGLSLSRWVAIAHGGKIEVDSQLGQGSTFHLWLPLAQDGVAAPRVAFAQHPVASPLTKRQPAHEAFKGVPIMQQQIARACYWLGIICGAVALGWRALVAIGFSERIQYADRAIGFEGFYKGAVLFLLVAVATSMYHLLRNAGE